MSDHAEPLLPSTTQDTRRASYDASHRSSSPSSPSSSSSSSSSSSVEDEELEVYAAQLDYHPKLYPEPFIHRFRWPLLGVCVVLTVFLVGTLWLQEDFPWTPQDERLEWVYDQDEYSGAFPTNVGYPGRTRTGVEALAAATAYPQNTDHHPIAPATPVPDFDILDYLGNLSPWKSVSHGLGTLRPPPAGCTIEQVQLLHRHGARYPTSGSGPDTFAKKLKRHPKMRASGVLEFLNGYEYPLGVEILTPFGRNQMFSLGAGFRVKYGNLLTPNQKPVFRTESQDRMLHSALNFAAGFFGIPFEEQYHQLITIEEKNFNNTLAPYMTCENGYRSDISLVHTKKWEWVNKYLKRKTNEFQPLVKGMTLTPFDLFSMQQLCAYEMVSLGGSVFCDLFPEKELWEGFEYALDLEFWWGYSFGQPVQSALGLGWVQEWLARTTKTPLTDFNTTTNATLHSSTYFPLDQKLYVDATHDTVISAILTTLNFSSLAAGGPLPSDHIPANRTFITSKVAPFAANLQSQVVQCGDETRVRWALNDGILPLSHIPGCIDDPDGFCSLDAFVASVQRTNIETNWAHECLDDWSLSPDQLERVTDGRRPL